MKNVKEMIRDEKGTYASFFAILLTLLLAVAGLLIDGGLVIKEKLELSAAADAAVLACVDAVDEWELEENEVVVLKDNLTQDTVNDILNRNMPEAYVDEINVRENKVHIVVKSKVEYTFMKLFGVEESTVKIGISCSFNKDFEDEIDDEDEVDEDIE